MIVALMCGHTDIEKFRKHKLNRVEQGRKFILDVQLHRNTWYGPILDRYFVAASFCAEEEFYLILLPFIFWNLDWLFAHHLLYVVNIGLYIGNVMKDVFALPRPSNVWRPEGLHLTDSAALMDFGFPSTHTMNGISNGIFFLLFYYTDGYGRTAPMGLPIWGAFLLAVWWGASLTFSRLWVGAHSPTDLRGGAVLGPLVAVVWYMVGAWSDDKCTIPSAMSLWFQVTSLTILILLSCPQLRPPTPTFLQNAVNMGLIMGNHMGANLHSQILANEAGLRGAWYDLSWVRDHTVGLYLARYAVGFAVVLAARAVTKAGVGAILEATGLKLKPKKGETVLQVTGWDLAGIATQKYLTYMMLATSVTSIVPALHYLIGLN